MVYIPIIIRAIETIKSTQEATYTISVTAVDNVGNETEKCDKILSLDIDAPRLPVITSSANYPVLTEYGISVDGRVIIGYDSRTDIDNYYSSDVETWTKYTENYKQTSGTIYAKSVKKATGLTISTTKEITTPGDALGTKAYDEDKNSSFDLVTGEDRYINILPKPKIVGTKTKMLSLYFLFLK